MWQKTKAGFGPGDLFCSLWNFVGLLPSNVDWSPKYNIRHDSSDEILTQF